MPSVALALAWPALLALAGAPPRTSAPLALEWHSQSVCESGADVEVEVARLLGSAQGEERPVRASAELTDEGRGSLQIRLELEVAGRSHERAFVAESCSAAKSAIALILAIAINPAAAQTQAAAEPTPDAEHPSTPETPSPPASTVEPAPPVQSPPREPALPWGISLGAAGLADAGSLPRVGAGLALYGGLKLGPARLELGGFWLAPQSAFDASGAGARFSVLHAELRAGYGGRLGAVWLGPMLGVGGSSLKARGTKGSSSISARDATELIPELTVGGLALWAVAPRLALRFSADGVVPLVRPRFLVVQPAPQDPTVVHRSPALGGRIMLGLSLQFL